MNENRHIKIYQITVITASVLLIILVAAAWIVSGPAQEWRSVQREYMKLSDHLGDSIADIALTGFRKGIREYNIKELNRTDRCVTCHAGMENPHLEGVQQPFGSHPGDMFQHHPPDKYGCTVCHGGQGRALNKKDAHGIDHSTHWEHPLLSYPYSQSSCGKCHLSIFSEGRELAGTDVFRQGQSIFAREGCLGCHKARGVGGIIGPDLTVQGEKTRHEYSFQNIDTEQTVSNWLKEHFRDPEMVSPGSQMLKIDLPEAELDALTTFVLGLARPDMDFEYFSMETLLEFKGNRATMAGDKVFSMACSGCHGKDGSGKDYEEYKTGIPGIGREDFIRVASKDYILFTLLKGRSLRQMASWDGDITGLKDEEILNLVEHISQHEFAAHPGYNNASFNNASTIEGGELFAEHCATCHGESGKGGTAIAVNRRDFLRYADNAFLYNTLIRGRDNATMPSWEILETEELFSIVTYLRSFQTYESRESEVKFQSIDPSDGKIKFHFLCMRCHGEAGQGQTGPAIINRDFLNTASNTYLYNTIAFGRGHTAMFGWSVDVYNNERLAKDDIGSIIAFMRNAESEPPAYIYAGSNPGSSVAGKTLFAKHCAECHGRDGEGPKGPALNNQELLSASSNGYLMATLAIGREGTQMPAWGRETDDHPALTGKERQDIVAWIRGWQRIKIGF